MHSIFSYLLPCKLEFFSQVDRINTAVIFVLFHSKGLICIIIFCVTFAAVCNLEFPFSRDILLFFYLLTYYRFNTQVYFFLICTVIRWK